MISYKLTIIWGFYRVKCNEIGSLSFGNWKLAIFQLFCMSTCYTKQFLKTVSYNFLVT